MEYNDPPSRQFHQSIRNKLSEAGVRDVRQTHSRLRVMKREDEGAEERNEGVGVRMRERRPQNTVEECMPLFVRTLAAKIREEREVRETREKLKSERERDDDPATASPKISIPKLSAIAAQWGSFFQQEKNVEEVLEYGKRIRAETVGQTLQGETALQSKAFHGSLEYMEIENFLGVQERVTIPFGEMQDGVWLIQGRNGSGKSTIMEGLCWCLFGDFIRSDMRKSYALNDYMNQGQSCRVLLQFRNGVLLH